MTLGEITIITIGDINMCLELKEGFKNIRFTFKRIECYKGLVQEVQHNGAKYTTPCQGSKVVIGKTYFSRLVKDSWGVENGLHSIEKIDDARTIVKKYFTSDTVLVKCVIPRFSFYYVGEYCGYNSYASSALKYVEIVS